MPANHFTEALPVLLLIAVGVIVRLTGLIDASSGYVLTRLAYYVTIPAAIFSAIARSQMTSEMLFLPVIGFTVPVLLSALGYLLTQKLAHQPEQRGVLIAGTVVLGVFGYPFFELFYGPQGLARVGLFDVGNAFFAGTLSLWLAQHFGQRSDHARLKSMLKSVLLSPIMWAAILGVVGSSLSWKLNGPLGQLVLRLAGANTPLAMIAVGIFLRPQLSYGRLAIKFLLLRFPIAALLGWALAMAFGMRGLDLIAACTASALPTGTTILVYATVLPLILQGFYP